MNSQRTKKILLVLGLSVLVILVCSPDTGWAQNPHFINSKTKISVNNDGTLTVCWKEAGLGDAETTYTLSGIASASCQCLTRSGNCPAASNKQDFQSEVTATGTFSPKNGTVSACLTIAAPECPESDPPTCGGGQSFELSSISYASLSLTDNTNDVTASTLPASQGPFNFFACP